jgi:hypothetical protein
MRINSRHSLAICVAFVAGFAAAIASMEFRSVSAQPHRPASIATAAEVATLLKGRPEPRIAMMAEPITLTAASTNASIIAAVGEDGQIEMLAAPSARSAGVAERWTPEDFKIPGLAIERQQRFIVIAVENPKRGVICEVVGGDVICKRTSN